MISHINTAETRILLLEGMERILPPYLPSLSAKAASLTRLGDCAYKTLVTDITDNVVTTRQGDQVEQISARTICGRLASKLRQWERFWHRRST